MGTTGVKRKRACVIGLDGVPFDLLLRFAEDGTMPAVNGMIRGGGHLHKMKASLPEVSSVSWTSFMTGTNPGTHGIFGFTDLRERSYQIRFPNFLDVKVPTLWDLLGEKGLRSIVINQPSTYPARKIEGALVAGFVAVDLQKAVYPPEHVPALESMGYEIDIDTEKARRDHSYLWSALDSSLKAGEQAFRYFWNQEWDFFEFVVTGTDRLHHYLWDAHSDPGHSCHGRFVEYYRKVDALIGCISEEFRNITGGLEGLYLLSDHGFSGIVQEVRLNAWLEKSGYLRFDTSAPECLTDLGPGTLAFALDPNRIYVNSKGRFPRGTVSDTRSVKEEIASGLKELRHGGREVVREVFDTEQIYSGPLRSRGPDLIVLPHQGFDMKGLIGTREVFGRSDLQGMHSWDDAFLLASRNRGDSLVIWDVAGMILEDLGREA